jgi:ADP-L-glycero-D-manno-heptose 6-epimerase
MILVTGCNGFIGGNLVDALGKSTEQITGIDEEYLQEDDWETCLQATLDRVNARAIFHVGACSDTLEKNVEYMMVRNYEATKVIADWCLKNDRKLIYSSSAANFGTNGRYPSNLYGWSKYVAEGYVTKCGGIALRYFNVFGPKECNKGEMASFLYQAYFMRKKKQVVRIFPGQPRRDFIYVKDVISANLHALEHYNEIDAKWYEVSTGIATDFEKVLDTASISYEYFGEEVIPHGYQFYTCGNPKNWMPNWEPQYTLEKAIEEYLEFLDEKVVN